MGFKVIQILLLCCTMTACNNSKATPIRQTEMPTDTITSFILPTIPLMLNTPELRADYLARHYWDNLNFADTNYIHHPEVTEQAWVDYIDLLKMVSPQTAEATLKSTFAQAEKAKESYLYLAELADKYLYDPQSPMRNEELYIPVLDALIASPVLDEAEKIRPIARRKLAQKNRIGTPAIDFAYTLASGKSSTLYAVRAPYTLLFINNPGCHACVGTIEALKNTPAIRHAIAQKQMKVLSIYPDEELDEWNRHLPDFPAEWINGYDRELTIKKQNLYDLKAIPTLYLLDKNKKVLLKDTTPEAIALYFQKQ